jgi:hypothetical protein
MQKEKVHRELIVLYNMRELTRHCDRDIFFETASDHLEAQPVWAIKNWLHIQRPLVLHSIKEAARQAVRHVRSISTYFTSAEPPA